MNGSLKMLLILDLYNSGNLQECLILKNVFQVQNCTQNVPLTKPD